MASRSPADCWTRWRSIQETLFLRFTGDYPYIRSRRLNLSAEAGFDYVDQQTDVLSGAATLSDDKLRVVFATAIFR